MNTGNQEFTREQLLDWIQVAQRWLDCARVEATQQRWDDRRLLTCEKMLCNANARIVNIVESLNVLLSADLGGNEALEAAKEIEAAEPDLA